MFRVWEIYALDMMWCLTLQSMGHTNHKFPIYATPNVQTHLKSTVPTKLSTLIHTHTHTDLIEVHQVPIALRFMVLGLLANVINIKPHRNSLTTTY